MRRKGEHMEITILISACVIVVLLILYRSGYNRMDSHKAAVLRVTEQFTENYHAKLLGQIAYHGGIPEMPKIAKAYFGLAPAGMVFCDGRGLLGQVLFCNWLAIENFSILQKSGNIGRSTALLGPLVPIFFKDKVRHFIVIKYIDIDQEENNILLEASDKKTQQKIYESISTYGKQSNQIKVS